MLTFMAAANAGGERKGMEGDYCHADLSTQSRSTLLKSRSRKGSVYTPLIDNLSCWNDENCLPTNEDLRRSPPRPKTHLRNRLDKGSQVVVRYLPHKRDAFGDHTARHVANETNCALFLNMDEKATVFGADKSDPDWGHFVQIDVDPPANGGGGTSAGTNGSGAAANSGSGGGGGGGGTGGTGAGGNGGAGGSGVVIVEVVG